MSRGLRWGAPLLVAAENVLIPKVVGSNPTPDLNPRPTALTGCSPHWTCESLPQRSLARISQIQVGQGSEGTYAPAYGERLERTAGDTSGLANELLLCIHIDHGATPGIATGRETASDHVLLGQPPRTAVRGDGRTDLAWTGLRARCGADRLARCPGSRRGPGRAACLLGLSGYLGWTTGGDPARARHSSVLGGDQSVPATGGIAAWSKGSATAEGMSRLPIPRALSTRHDREAQRAVPWGTGQASISGDGSEGTQGVGGGTRGDR